MGGNADSPSSETKISPQLRVAKKIKGLHGPRISMDVRRRTWYSDKAGELSFERYFAWLKEKRATVTAAIAGRTQGYAQQNFG